MGKDIKDGTDMTIGVDLGDKWSRLCVLDELGEVCEEGRIASTATTLALTGGYLLMEVLRVFRLLRIPIWTPDAFRFQL